MTNIVERLDARFEVMRISQNDEMSDVALIRDASAEIRRLWAVLAACRDALAECRDEIGTYILREYPSDHPVQKRRRDRDMAANPARAALEPRE